MWSRKQTLIYPLNFDSMVSILPLLGQVTNVQRKKKCMWRFFQWLNVMKNMLDHLTAPTSLLEHWHIIVHRSPRMDCSTVYKTWINLTSCLVSLGTTNDNMDTISFLCIYIGLLWPQVWERHLVTKVQGCDTAWEHVA